LGIKILLDGERLPKMKISWIAGLCGIFIHRLITWAGKLNVIVVADDWAIIKKTCEPLKVKRKPGD
jgi:hypothetical protein